MIKLCATLAGNVDESLYARAADPKIGLTDKGKAEAEEVGWEIREMIEKDGADDWKVYFYGCQVTEEPWRLLRYG